MKFSGPRSGRGALIAIAGLLIASAGLRIATGAGSAIAREMTDVPTEMAEATCAPPPEIKAVLDGLKEREDRLSTAENAFADRMQTLRVAEDEIQRNLVALTNAEQALASTLAIADGAAEDDLARLTAVYENMKPKEAALLFETMAPDFAAGFLGRMRPEAAAGIFAGLQPDVAYSISAILAGRNATAPTE